MELGAGLLASIFLVLNSAGVSLHSAVQPHYQDGSRPKRTYERIDERY